MKVLHRRNENHPSYSGDNSDWGYCHSCNNYFKYKDEPKAKQWFLYCHPGDGCDYMVCRSCVPIEDYSAEAN